MKSNSASNWRHISWQSDRLIIYTQSSNLTEADRGDILTLVITNFVTLEFKSVQ